MSHDVSFDKWLSYQPWIGGPVEGQKWYTEAAMRAAWDAGKTAQPEAVPTREDLRKHFQDWWELYNANKLDGDEFTTLVATMLQFELPTPQHGSPK